jgi:hypothetical protein
VTAVVPEDGTEAGGVSEAGDVSERGRLTKRTNVAGG